MFEDYKRIVNMGLFQTLSMDSQWLYFKALSVMDSDGYASLYPYQFELESTRDLDYCIAELESRGFIDKVNDFYDVSINLTVGYECEGVQNGRKKNVR